MPNARSSAKPSTPQPIQFPAGSAHVCVHGNAELSAAAAAASFAAAVQKILARKPDCNAIFAGAQSQMPFHQALCRRADIPWEKIRAFSVDDFYAPGMPPQYAVAAQPRRDLYPHVKPFEVFTLDFNALDPQAEADRYEALLRRHKPDIACIGIGISGHLALNEPGAAKFHDDRWVRVVDVPPLSQQQLMTDPNFMALGQIPTRGLTMTLPALMQAQTILAIVPYRLKAPVIRRFLTEPVAETFPASILKTHPDATVYLDPESFSQAADLPRR